MVVEEEGYTWEDENLIVIAYYTGLSFLINIFRGILFFMGREPPLLINFVGNGINAAYPIFLFLLFGMRKHYKVMDLFHKVIKTIRAAIQYDLNNLRHMAFSSYLSEFQAYFRTITIPTDITTTSTSTTTNSTNRKLHPVLWFDNKMGLSMHATHEARLRHHLAEQEAQGREESGNL